MNSALNLLLFSPGVLISFPEFYLKMKWKITILGSALTLHTNRVCVDACIYKDMGILGKDVKKLEKKVSTLYCNAFHVACVYM
jgi:hypothetical protein